MEIIGCVLNTSVDGINEMLDARDLETLLTITEMQLARGAERISVNCGSRVDSEIEDLLWMVREIQKRFEVPLAIDSPNPRAHREVLPELMYGRPMVNSVTAEQDRLESLLPLVRRHNAQVTALLMDGTGMPEGIDQILRTASVIAEAAGVHGINPEDVYLDAGVFPLSVDDQNGSTYLQALQALREKYPRFSTICGLNNISYGLPGRELIDMMFLAVLAQSGQSAAYVELHHQAGAAVYALNLLYGRDKHCSEYLKGYRAGHLL